MSPAWLELIIALILPESSAVYWLIIIRKEILGYHVINIRTWFAIQSGQSTRFICHKPELPKIMFLHFTSQSFGYTSISL